MKNHTISDLELTYLFLLSENRNLRVSAIELLFGKNLLFGRVYGILSVFLEIFGGQYRSA